MSTRVNKQFGGNGWLRIPGVGTMFDSGPTVPTDGTAGFGPNCIFLDNDATGPTGVYINVGTAASCDFNQLNGGLDTSIQTLATGAAAGITGGTGTIYKNTVRLWGGIYYTTIMLDVTGLGTSTTDLDIVGTGTSAAHLGQITAARNGTILFGRMTCFEVPATGADDLDLYSAVEATGKFDDAVTGLTETALITAGGAWTAAGVKVFTAVPAAGEYLYLTNGEAGTVGTFTAGQFLIELFGY